MYIKIASQASHPLPKSYFYIASPPILFFLSNYTHCPLILSFRNKFKIRNTTHKKHELDNTSYILIVKSNCYYKKTITTQNNLDSKIWFIWAAIIFLYMQKQLCILNIYKNKYFISLRLCANKLDWDLQFWLHSYTQLQLQHMIIMI